MTTPTTTGSAVTQRFVLDASVAIKWFIPEPYSAAALKFLDSRFEHHVPSFFRAEFANTIWKMVGQRHQLTETEGEEILQELDLIPLIIHHENLERQAFDLIRTVRNPKLAIYDFIYLALAEAIDSPMITADRIFFDALVNTPYRSRMLWVEDLPS